MDDGTTETVQTPVTAPEPEQHSPIDAIAGALSEVAAGNADAGVGGDDGGSSGVETEAAPVDTGDAIDDLGDDYTDEEKAALAEAFQKWLENGGQPAPVQPEAAPATVAETQAPAPVSPSAPAPPATPRQVNDGVIPQYSAEIPQEVIEAAETGDIRPYHEYVRRNEEARDIALVGNLNRFFANDLLPTLGNMAETAAIALSIQQQNPLYEACHEDVVRSVHEYRVQNPNASLAQAMRDVAAKLGKDTVTANAMAKLKKRGLGFMDLRKPPAPNAPRTNARTSAKAQTTEVPSIARGIAAMLGRDTD